MSKFVKKLWLPFLISIGLILSLSLSGESSIKSKPTEFSISNLASEPLYEYYEFGANNTPTMHSATAVTLPNGNLLGAWYGGTGEGKPDVQLFTSVFNTHDQVWSAPVAVLDRLQAANELNRFIKKLGNPVLYRHPSGVITLFYVSVSIGGWATSNINMVLSFDDGQTWHPSKRLVVTPFLNISTLIKNDVITYNDGTFGLPVYHELIGEFSHIIRLNLHGEVLDSYRITDGEITIQPSIVSYDDQSMIAMMRDSGRDIEKIHRSESHDSGMTWSEYEPTLLDNPNAAVFAFVDNKKRTWMLFNDSNRKKERPRNNLALAVSLDKGKSWKIVKYLENPNKDDNHEGRYGYPWVTTQGDIFHIIYTSNRENFVHIRLNQAWLETLL
ncbi:exo-alpha-sialidase [Oceaniserpentilla sp. 4NH20-0058]|uniref:sialidase family protein n=1 Tax=Oceaniserpentilla sp. 4NH20-0058 TaxID=3127660 RepID=UPI003109894E